jgi:thiol-disulfide isomerase/thioredoxin
VIFFETSWCHYCHEFAPQFDEARRKYQNKMDFQQMDAEHDGASLAQRYGVHSYPSLVYLDGSGKLLYNEGRGEFQNRIKELTGQ